MSSQNLSIAFYTRWNNAGLDSSVAELYPGGQGVSSSQNKGGAPVNTAKPRAEYFVIDPAPNAKSRGSRLHMATVMVTVVGTTKDLVDEYIDLIHAAFINADEAATNPMTLSSGNVMEVDDGGSVVEKVDDDTFEGTKTILIRYSIQNAIPA